MPVVPRAQGIRITPHLWMPGPTQDEGDDAVVVVSGGATGPPVGRQLKRPALPLTSKAHPADHSDPNSPLMRANLRTGDHWWILRSHV